MINNIYFDYYKDNYNIYNLITKINKYYRMVFNKKEKNFNIINIAKNNQICLKFNSFSENIINKLLKTRVENSYQIFKNIDECNEKIKDKNQLNTQEELSDKITNLLNYSKRVNSISNRDIELIIKGQNA